MPVGLVTRKILKWIRKSGSHIFFFLQWWTPEALTVKEAFRHFYLKCLLKHILWTILRIQHIDLWFYHQNSLILITKDLKEYNEKRSPSILLKNSHLKKVASWTPPRSAIIFIRIFLSSSITCFLQFSTFLKIITRGRRLSPSLLTGVKPQRVNLFNLSGRSPSNQLRIPISFKNPLLPLHVGKIIKLNIHSLFCKRFR